MRSFTILEGVIQQRNEHTITITLNCSSTPITIEEIQLQFPEDYIILKDDWTSFLDRLDNQIKMPNNFPRFKCSFENMGHFKARASNFLSLNRFRNLAAVSMLQVDGRDDERDDDTLEVGSRDELDTASMHWIFDRASYELF